MVRKLTVFSLWVAVLISLLSTISGCQGMHKRNAELQALSPAFIRVFSDFEIVGTGPGGHDPAAITPHGVTSQPLPKIFAAGHQYIFHRLAKKSNGEVFEVLQDRLRANGVQILHAGCCLDAVIGGPGFNIKFKDGDYRATIFNRLDGQIAYDGNLSGRYEVDDYVVVIEEAPSSR